MIVLLLIDWGRSDRFLIRSHRAKSRCPSALRGDDGCLDFARHERDNRTVRSRWVLSTALARDRLRAKGRARYGKLVGTSWRAAADTLRLSEGAEHEGATHARPARQGRSARDQRRR